MNGDGAFSTFAGASLHAGNGGPGGAKGGAGGSVIGADVQALTDVTLIAGNATATGSGAGGSITSSGFSGVLKAGAGFNPPSGNVTIQAGGGGSPAVGNAGAGGSISGVTGFISTGDGGVNSYITDFIAGAGGNSNGTAKAGAGGSVSNVRFFGGGGAGVTFFINAGDAGSAPGAKTGATGGSVANIGGGTQISGSNDANFSVSTLTDFHHISAGNGGAASAKGGLGGSVSNVFVNAAIGIRTGAPFGFDIAGINGAAVTGMGGISAGAGGAGAIAGLAGNVSNIAADAIASIVAGHLSVGQAFQKTNLANKVDGIILNGANAPSLVHQFELTFDGETTVQLPTNATPVQVASALNALPNIQAAGGVTVVKGANGYIVTFNQNGAEDPITGDEPTAVVDGNTTVTSSNNFGQEVQSVTVTINPFSLAVSGQDTTVLPARATAAEVSAALNALPAIQNRGGVTVAITPGTGNNNPGYTITFNNQGPNQPLITPIYSQYSQEVVPGTATTAEQQNVEVFGIDPFTLTFQGDMTTQLPANATAAQVQTALDALPTIQSAGDVTVTGPTGALPTYNITFNSPGAEPLINPNFSLTTVDTAGNASAATVETLTFPTRGDLNPVQIATANFVGSIFDVSRPNSTVFAYTPTGSAFAFGDVPIDGMIAAVTLTSNKNFVPEAFITENAAGAAVLVDNTAS